MNEFCKKIIVTKRRLLQEFRNFIHEIKQMKKKVNLTINCKY